MFKSEVTILKKENTRQLLSLKDDAKKNINSIMKSMSIFRINSYDAQVILRDLIGMSQELEIRGSSLEESISSDLKGFVNDIIDNSAGPSKAEISLGFLMKLSSMFCLYFGILSIGAYSSLTFTSSNILFLFYFGMTLIAFVTEGLITPHFSVENGIKKHVPILISMLLVLGLAAITFIMINHDNTTTINAGYIIIASGAAYMIASYLNVKNISRLSKCKKNFISDLISK